MLRGCCLRILRCQNCVAQLRVPSRGLSGAFLNSAVYNHNAVRKPALQTHPVFSSHCVCPKRLVSVPLRQQTTTTGVTQSVTDVQQREDHLSITVDSQTFRVSYLWLRDHCRCSWCYDHACRENFVDIIALPSDIAPQHVMLEDGSLKLTWPDDHVTTYSLQWLQNNAPSQSSAKTAQQLQPFYWDKKMVVANPPEDVHLEALRDGSGLRKVMENLHVHGFTFVSGLEATKESSEEAINLISPPLETFYGRVWQYQNDGEVADAGYTSVALKNHTDFTYCNHAPGGLVLHCLHHDGTGGENILADGFRAAQLLREMEPEHYETLLTIPVMAHYLDDTRDFRYCHRVLTENALTKELQQLRFNPHDRSTLSYASYEEAERFYAAYRALGRIIESPDMVLKTKLQPGRMVVFDNWRLLHGRTGFTGKRVMVGCYFTRDDIQNLKRMEAKLKV